jgi:hypothetical protein
LGKKWSVYDQNLPNPALGIAGFPVVDCEYQRMQPIARLVDALPARWWHPANLHVGGRLHFCHEPARPGESVRTVEWNGRVVARGRRNSSHELTS